MSESTPPTDDACPVDAASSAAIPPWTEAELPEPKPLRWRNWTSFLGPGIVMMGIQIGGGEWLYGPAITAKYGGGLMWIASVAIVLQVFYNLECGRYALYCGEPVFTVRVMVVNHPAASVRELSGDELISFSRTRI